ncbi:uncharacterized protein LOC123864615 [Maniola jurtina]|uniref:uncharacterized protein LOC123864615 n=1 Tax=Maniola jurtina TaxID=191418 RepID=UPI001E68A956|nr:uncharacterized protein LOC123864615 [Maniola jurtina]
MYGILNTDSPVTGSYEAMVTVNNNHFVKMIRKQAKLKRERKPDWKASNAHIFDYRQHIADIIYGQGNCGNVYCLPCGDSKVPSCNVSWRNLIDKFQIHKKCDELVTNCYFNTVKFPCCKHFYTVDSESGPCYSFNSLQGPYTGNLQFYVNRSTGPGLLSFRLLSNAEVSVHSSEELSTEILDSKFKFKVDTYLQEVVDYSFSIVEMHNEPVLEDEDINIRKCRYGHEIPDLPLHTYQVYSYGGCCLAQSTAEAFNYCHCIHPVRDIRYKHIYCNYTGINCLIKYKVPNSKLENHGCTDTVNCLPACAESELYTIHVAKIEKLKPNRENGSLINIRMVALPTMRYHKRLLRTNMDFVVTIGGMVGLFFSASILSFAEIFYLILRSPNSNK